MDWTTKLSTSSVKPATAPVSPSPIIIIPPQPPAPTVTVTTTATATMPGPTVTMTSPGSTVTATTAGPTVTMAPVVTTARLTPGQSRVAVKSSWLGAWSTLSWVPPGDAGGLPITGYRVARDGVDARGGGRYSTVVPANARSLRFTLLRPGAVYHFSVQPRNARGFGEVTVATVRLVAPAPRRYANCTALNRVYPHGVKRAAGVRDRASRATRVTTAYASRVVYNLNVRLDRDKDAISCEKR